MSRESKLMVFGLVCVALFVSLADQRTTANPSDQNAVDVPPTRIALIDMAQVFKEYSEFERLREELKGEIALSEKLAKAMAEQIKGLQEQLKNLPKNSDDYADQENKIQKLSGEFETFRRNTQRIILQKESAIYREIYDEVSTEVEKYAAQHKLDLVLRFNADPLPDNDPQELIKSMNRQVVFQRGLDITNPILETLNAKLKE